MVENSSLIMPRTRGGIGVGGGDGERQRRPSGDVQSLRLVLYATNLPKQGNMVRKRSPNSYAVVTSVSSKETTSGGGGGSMEHMDYFVGDNAVRKEHLGSEQQEWGRSHVSDNQEELESARRSSMACAGYHWGETEIVYHSRNPQYTKAIPFRYKRGTQLHFYVQVRAADDDANCYAAAAMGRAAGGAGLDDSTSFSEDAGGGGGGLDGSFTLLSVAPNAPNGANKQHNHNNSAPELGFVGLLQPSPMTKRSTSCESNNTNRGKQNDVQSFGTALFEVSDILKSARQTKIKRLRSGACIGCRIEEPLQHAEGITDSVCERASSFLRFQLGAVDLKHPNRRKGGILQFRSFEPDTYLEIAKRPPTLAKSSLAGQAWVTVYRSQPIFASAQPVYDVDQLDLGTLCNGNYDNHLRLSVWMLFDKKEPFMLGLAETTLKHLLLSVESAKRTVVAHEGNGSDKSEPAGGAAAAGSNNNKDNNKKKKKNGSSEEIAVDFSPFGPSDSPSTPALHLQQSSSNMTTVGYLKVYQADILNGNSESHPAVLRNHHATHQQQQLASLDENSTAIGEANGQQQPSLQGGAVAAQSPRRTEIPNHEFSVTTANHHLPAPTLGRNGSNGNYCDSYGDNDNVLETSQNSLGSFLNGSATEIEWNQPDVDPAYLTTTMRTSARFLDYMERMRCEFDCCIAIDFTSSNGNPYDDLSLHSQRSDALNEYEETITSICQALQNFDSTENFAMWGFGAKFHTSGQVQQCFQLGHGGTVSGVSEVLDAYRHVFRTGLTMSGPTDFTKVVQAAAVRARKHEAAMMECAVQNGRPILKKYTILIVITDGVMERDDDLRRKLGVYSAVPLSIIFVGVGNNTDFSPMYRLYEHGGIRQNVHFVEYREHQENPSALGFAALQDLPRQVCEYIEKNSCE